MKQVYKLKIDEELRDLLPPLTTEEYKQLEENLIKDGCQSPLFTWNGFIADGHNRYNICQKNQIPFEIITLGFNDKSDVMRWMIDGQLGRRNLEPIQRVQVTEKYRPIFEEKAKANQRASGGAVPQKSAKPIDTRDELAKLAGVSHDTYNKGRTILKSDNEEVKQKVLTGEMSINAGYNEIKPKVDKPKTETIKESVVSEKVEVKSIAKVCKICSIEKPLIDFFGNDDICKECKKSTQYEDSSKSQGGGSFKDIATGQEVEFNKDSVNSESMNEILKEIKTEKIVEDCVNPDHVIEWTKEVCDDFVDQLVNQYFVIQKAIVKMDDVHINNAVEILETVVSKIKGIEIKLNNKKENN